MEEVVAFLLLVFFGGFENTNSKGAERFFTKNMFQKKREEVRKKK